MNGAYIDRGNMW